MYIKHYGTNPPPNTYPTFGSFDCKCLKRTKLRVSNCTKAPENHPEIVWKLPVFLAFFYLLEGAGFQVKLNIRKFILNFLAICKFKMKKLKIQKIEKKFQKPYFFQVVENKREKFFVNVFNGLATFRRKKSKKNFGRKRLIPLGLLVRRI